MARNGDRQAQILSDDGSPPQGLGDQQQQPVLGDQQQQPVLGDRQPQPVLGDRQPQSVLGGQPPQELRPGAILSSGTDQQQPVLGAGAILSPSADQQRPTGLGGRSNMPPSVPSSPVLSSDTVTPTRGDTSTPTEGRQTIVHQSKGTTPGREEDKGKTPPSTPTTPGRDGTPPLTPTTPEAPASENDQEARKRLEEEAKLKAQQEQKAREAEEKERTRLNTISQAKISIDATDSFKQFKLDNRGKSGKELNDNIRNYADSVMKGGFLAVGAEQNGVTPHGNPPVILEKAGPNGIQFEFAKDNQTNQLVSDKARTLTIPHKDRFGNPDPSLGVDVLEFKKVDGQMVCTGFAQSGDPANSQLDQKWLKEITKDLDPKSRISGVAITGDEQTRPRAKTISGFPSPADMVAVPGALGDGTGKAGDQLRATDVDMPQPRKRAGSMAVTRKEKEEAQARPKLTALRSKSPTERQNDGITRVGGADQGISKGARDRAASQGRKQ